VELEVEPVAWRSVRITDGGLKTWREGSSLVGFRAAPKVFIFGGAALEPGRFFVHEKNSQRVHSQCSRL
jgi:hypothetical protein